MSNTINCVDCKKEIPANTPRPTYVAKAMRRAIRPFQRCDECRAEYERTHTGLEKKDA